jgi:hypothetical protein
VQRRKGTGSYDASCRGRAGRVESSGAGPKEEERRIEKEMKKEKGEKWKRKKKKD